MFHPTGQTNTLQNCGRFILFPFKQNYLLKLSDRKLQIIPQRNLHVQFKSNSGSHHFTLCSNRALSLSHCDARMLGGPGALAHVPCRKSEFQMALIVKAPKPFGLNTLQTEHKKQKQEG